MDNFIYSLGEAIMLELDEVCDVTYPSDIAPDSLLAHTKSGKEYVITVKQKN